MAKLSMQVASTSQTVNVFIQDSSVTTGAGLTGLTYTSTSLSAFYILPRAAATTLSLATLAAATSSFSAGGFKEIDGTNAPGLYRLDIPNAAIASGRFSTIILKGAANMAPCVLEIELTGPDNQDAVRGGMTALPNVASGSAGALIVSGTGTAALSVSGGVAQADIAKINGNTTSPGKLDRGVRGTVTITVGSASTSTSVIASAVSPSSIADDQFLGKVLTFDDNTTTTQLRGQSTVVTDYTHSTLTFTVNALTIAPSSGDTATLT